MVDLTTQKQAALTNIQDAKNTSLASNVSLNDIKNASLSGISGFGQGSLTPTEQLTGQLPSDLVQQYGDLGYQIASERNAEDAANEISSNRSNDQILGDSLLGIGQGFGNTFGGIAALGAGLVNTNAGVAVSKGMDDFNSWMNSNKSATSQNSLNDVEREVSLDDRDVEKEFQKNISDSSGLMDKLSAYGKRFTKEGLNRASTTLTNPTALTDLVSQGVGSLATFAPEAKGISLLGNAGLKALGKVVDVDNAVKGVKAASAIDKATSSLSAARVADAIGSKVAELAPVTLTGASQEAGGAYQGSVSDVMNMSDDDLQKNAPNYDQILASVNGDKDAARKIIANRAGLTAAAIAGPAGAITSHIAGKFEMHPTASVDLKAAGSNLIKEGTEEGLQGVTGQLGQNIGEKQNADKTKDLAEGLADQAVEGAIGGIGAAGGPTTIGIAKGTLSNIKDAALNRVQKASDEVENVSPTSDKNLSDTVDTIKTQAPEVQSQINNGIQEADIAPEQKQDIQDYTKGIIDTATMNPADHIEDDDPKEVKDALTSANNPVTAIRNLMSVHSNEDVNPDVRTTALDVAQSISGHIDEQLDKAKPAGFDNLPDHVKGFIGQYQDLIDSFKGATNTATQNADDTQTNIAQSNIGQSLNNISDSIKDANTSDNLNEPTINKINTQLSNLSSDEISQLKSNPDTAKALDDYSSKVKSITGNPINITGYDSSEQTPEQQEQSVKNAQLNAKLIERNPEQATPSILNQISYHEDNGNITLTPNQQVAVKAAKAVTDALQETAKSSIDSEDPKSLVSQQIAYEDGSKGPSALTYAREIYKAYRDGDFEKSKSYMNSLKNFAQSQSNKIAAINEHYSSGSDRAETAIPYESVNHDTGEFFSSPNGMWVNSKAPKSIQNAQHFSDEATALSNLYNHLAKAFPEVSAGKQTAVKLNPNLIGKPEEIANRHKTENVDRSIEQTNNNKEPEVKEEKPVTESVKEPIKEEPKIEKDVSKVYPNLVGGEHNLFKNNFTRIESSKIMNEEHPIDRLEDALKDFDSLTELVPENRLIGKRINSDIAKAYSTYLDLGKSIVQNMNEMLDSNLHNEFKTKGRTTTNLIETLNDPENHLRKSQNKAFVFAEPVTNKSGKVVSLKYNDNLVQLAVLAGLNWSLTNTTVTHNYDNNQVRVSLGLGSNVTVSNELVQAFNAGMDQQSMIQNLANSIKAFWGVKAKANTASGLTDGAVYAMAIQVLQGLKSAGIISEPTYISYDEDGNIIPTTSNSNKFARYTYLKDIKNTSMSQYSSLIQDMIESKPEPVFLFDTNNLPAPKSMSSNPLVKLSSDQKNAAKVAMQIPHLPNMPVINFYKSFGRNSLLDAFGGQSNLEGKFNKNHFEAVKGKNMSISGAYDYLTRMMDEAQNYADAVGVSVEEQPHYFKMAFSSVNRLMYQGTYTPQSNKLLREAVMTTWHNYDLSKIDSEEGKAWQLGLAQMLGVKVHQMTTDQSIEKLQGVLADAKPTLSVLSKWLDNQGVLSSNDKSTLVKNINDLGIGFAGLNALMDYAKYQKSEDRSNFRSPVYVEADGMSNGSANAMAGFANGERTPTWYDNMESVGLFFNKSMDNNTYRQESSSKDLYEKTLEHLVPYHNAFVDSLPDNVKSQAKAVMAFISSFDPNYSITHDYMLSPDTSRGAIKNPQTQVVYSASPAGIAGTLVGNISKTLYETATKFAQDKAKNPSIRIWESMYPDLSSEDAKKKFAITMRATQSLLKATPKISFNDISLENTNNDRNIYSAIEKNPIEFTLNDNELKALKSNISELFTSSLHASVAESMTNTVMDTLDLLQDSMQLKSIVASDAFDKEIKNLTEEKKANSNWLPSDGFTNKEISDVFKKIEPLLAMVHSNSGTTSFGDTIRYNPFSSVFNTATGFKGQGMSISAPINGVGLAGNSPKPNYVIGTGDGAAILKAYNDPKLPSGSTQIWDGVHFPAVNAKEAGQFMNQKVLESWQENNMKPVADSYSAMIDYLEKNNFNLSDDTLKQIAVTLLGRKEGSKLAGNRKAIIDQIRAFNTRLQENAKLGDERANMFKTENLSVNNMSSVAGSNYISNGKETETKSEEPKKSKLVKMDVNGLMNTLSQHTSKFSDGQKAVLKELKRTDHINDWTVVMGSPESLNNYSNNSIGRDIFTSNNQKGATHVGSNTIYLTSGKAETVIHELVHAATLQAVYGVYSRSAMGRNRQYAHRAVRDIERMMSNVIYTNPEFLQNASPELRKSYNNMVNQITQIKAQRQPKSITKTLAMNEFMAWGLANKNLIEAFTKAPSNPIFNLADKIIRGIKKIVFGANDLPPEGNNLFNKLLFSTSVLMQSQPKVSSELKGTASYQSVGFGSDERLANIANHFDRSLFDQLDADGINIEKASNERAKANMLYTQAVVYLTAAGFHMNPQQATTFKSIVLLMATAAKINPAFATRAQNLMNYAYKNLSMKDFMTGSDLEDVADTTEATNKLNALFSANNLQKDSMDRSSILPVFIGMAVTNLEVRNALSKISSPSSLKEKDGTMDRTLENIGLASSDILSNYLSGENKNSNIDATINGMVDALVSVAHDRNGLFDRVSDMSGNAIDTMNKKVIQGIEFMGQKTEGLGKSIQNSDNKYVKKAGAVIEFFGKIASSKDGEEISKGIEKLAASSSNHTFREFLTELNGRTSTNADVIDRMKQFATAIQQTRQKFREEVPGVIASKFLRKLSDKEWSDVTKGLGKTDFASLENDYSMDQMFKLFSDKNFRNSEISKYENNLKNDYSEKDQKFIDKKINELVNYMNNGIASENMLSNANAIANLLTTGSKITATHSMINNVDKLITLKALNTLPTNTINSVKSLMEKEHDGMSFLAHYLVGQRNTEMTNVSNSAAAYYNHYKGYFHKEQGQGHSLIVALDDTDGKELLKKSYTRVGDYKGSSRESGKASRGYYYAPVNGNTVFNQGMFQNVKVTASGVSSNTGVTSGSKIAGLISNRDEVKAILASKASGSNNGESLRPIFDSHGNIRAFERMVDPKQLDRLEYDTHAARMIGAWRGRQVEELEANELNKGMINSLFNMYVEDTKHNNNKEDYENLFESKDPVVQDALGIMSKDLKEHIQSVFGPNQFLVHKTLINDAIGFHRASVGDAWTGNSRWSPAVLKTVRDASVAVLGNDAYQYMTKAERFWQDRVADAKVTIVVKSMIVAFKNLKDNILQLLVRGVNPISLVKGFVSKTNELNQYIKGRQREIAAEAELRASVNPNHISRLRTELQSIKDGYKRLSIYPLIKAGEFAGISDEGLKREDLDLANGRWENFFEAMVDKLPEEVRTAGRYATIAKDTPLFQGLQKAVEYGDFLSKAVYFDHLMDHGSSEKDALGAISEEFINYSRSQGRTRDYLDSMGLTWFMNTKVRLAKVAVSMIKKNPLQSLFAGLADQSEMLGSVDTPMGSNIFTLLADGRIENSIGLGQLFRAPLMNPLIQILR